jgi:hypothetical protein
MVYSAGSCHYAYGGGVFRHRRLHGTINRIFFLSEQWGDAKPGSMWRDDYLSAGWDPEEWRGGRILDNTLWLGEKRDSQRIHHEGHEEHEDQKGGNHAVR